VQQKLLVEHGTSLGGVMVTVENLTWDNGKFPEFTEPCPSYHGMVFNDTFKPLNNISYITKGRVALLRDMGPCLSPFNAFLLLQGLGNHSFESPPDIAKFAKSSPILEKHKAVNLGKLSGLPSHSNYDRAQSNMPRGQGAIIGFGIKGDLPAAKKFIDNLKLISHLANILDAKTLVIHPASTTHQQLSLEEQKAAGVTPDFIRLSVGLEDIEDILEDLEQAFDKSQE
jgi:O-acetylhomoserine (thiol)-lyase